MQSKQKLVILTGAGMSAESGLRTFRDMGGLWESYDIHDVATFDAWIKNRDLVLRFYNERRAQLEHVAPNLGHYGLYELEKDFDVHIITQNVDDLHERAGSTHVLHLHGELTKVRSTMDDSLVYDITYKLINNGDKCELGSQLRPHIVWFGEMVPEIDNAVKIVEDADIFVVIGTSLEVYPAAGLINYVDSNVPIYVIDPSNLDVSNYSSVNYIQDTAVNGVAKLTEMLLSSF